MTTTEQITTNDLEGVAFYVANHLFDGFELGEDRGYHFARTGSTYTDRKFGIRYDADEETVTMTTATGNGVLTGEATVTARVSTENLPALKDMALGFARLCA